LPNQILRSKRFKGKLADALRKKLEFVKTGILWSFVRLRFQNGGTAAILDPSPPCDQYPKDKQTAGRTLQKSLSPNAEQ